MSSKFLDSDGVLRVVERVSNELQSTLDSKELQSIISGTPTYLSIDNTNPRNPVIRLTPEFVGKIEDIFSSIGP